VVIFQEGDDAAHHNHAGVFRGLFDFDDLEAAGDGGFEEIGAVTAAGLGRPPPDLTSGTLRRWSSVGTNIPRLARILNPLQASHSALSAIDIQLSRTFSVPLTMG